MAYFDSPKNRAMWEKELSGLRQEKQFRAENGYTKQNQVQKQKESSSPYRVRITFAELLERENMKNGKTQQGGRSRTKAVERSKEKQHEELTHQR